MATRLEMIEAHLGKAVVKDSYWGEHAAHRAALELRAGCAAHRIREYIPGRATSGEVEAQLRLARELQEQLDAEGSGKSLCACAREIVLALESVTAKDRETQRTRVEDVLRIADLTLEELR